jgi:hypothetical protein
MSISGFESHLFLEPAHLHGLKVSPVVKFPAEMKELLPESFQIALKAVQASTSIMFSSFERLQNLRQEQSPAPEPEDDMGKISFESPIADYLSVNLENRIRAESIYFFEEATPDWRHKAMRLIWEFQNSAPHLPKVDMEFYTWWNVLQSMVHEWQRKASSPRG